MQSRSIIDGELLPYVSDRFRHADSSTRRSRGGLGLGLSIVKHIVELHRGTVTAASAGEGRGAKFIVHLPVQAVRIPEAMAGTESADHAADKQRKPVSVRLDGVRVLVVDDEVSRPAFRRNSSQRWP